MWMRIVVNLLKLGFLAERKAWEDVFGRWRFVWDVKVCQPILFLVYSTVVTYRGSRHCTNLLSLPCLLFFPNPSSSFHTSPPVPPSTITALRASSFSPTKRAMPPFPPSYAISI
ncbi:hypothetical protein CC80DRAFT_120423 [Byssothecium circinans]|uniref:Uncharacterized protein n=1 Tax=Byssothecium circinans TaxID=147558 RepID=A0A6A5TV25_9PLEO|nr:hypothetical protein CC80DRAFT_120423 [Byssothecium circinans]